MLKSKPNYVLHTPDGDKPTLSIMHECSYQSACLTLTPVEALELSRQLLKWCSEVEWWEFEVE